MEWLFGFAQRLCVSRFSNNLQYRELVWLVNPELFNLVLGFVMPSTNSAKKNFENHVFARYEHYTAILYETLIAIQKYYRFLLISRISCFLPFLLQYPLNNIFHVLEVGYGGTSVKATDTIFPRDLCTNYSMSSCWRLHQQVCLCQIDMQNLMLVSLFITDVKNFDGNFLKT
jgi:hypothetical protein